MSSAEPAEHVASHGADRADAVLGLMLGLRLAEAESTAFQTRCECLVDVFGMDGSLKRSQVV